MIAALLLADLEMVVSVSTFAMLLYYLIANIAALRLPREHRKYPAFVPVIGALSCLTRIIFLKPCIVDHRVHRAPYRWIMVLLPQKEYLITVSTHFQHQP